MSGTLTVQGAKGGEIVGVRVVSTGARYTLDRRCLQYRVGTDPTVCQIVIDDPGVSALHCRIEWHGHWLLVDNNSKNGTLLNGQLCKGAVLTDGARIDIGTHTRLVIYSYGRSYDKDGPSVQSFVGQERRRYPSDRRAAAALGIPASTLRRKYKPPEPRTERSTMLGSDGVPEPIEDDR